MIQARRSPPAGASVKVHGPALRFVRETYGLSIAEVARAAGVSVGFLARVERGDKRGVGPEVFERIVGRLAPVDRRVLLVNPYVIGNTATVMEQEDTAVLPFGSTSSTAA